MTEFRTRKSDKQAFPLRKKTSRDSGNPEFVGVDKRQIETKKVTKYIGDGFEFNHQPIDDTINIKKTKDGYEAKYLSYDEDPQSPDEWGDNNLFLVHYHRDFYIDRKNIITKDDAKDWYQGGKLDIEKNYHIIPVESYIHGGVSLAIQNKGNFPDRKWDVSNVGLALVSKKEFKTKQQATKAVNGLIGEWNQYLSGDVYTITKERYNNKKEPIDYDVVGGYYGYNNALKELKDF